MVLGAYDPGHYLHTSASQKDTKHIPGNNRFKQMTREQFEQWLDTVDSNHDGCISREELYAALEALGLHFKTWKTWRVMRRCDGNHNNLIDPGSERTKLIDYAKKRWGIIVTN